MSRPVPDPHPPFENERQAARWWLDNVYAGDDAVQLSPRAVVTGMAIGGVMSISNLYVGLKTGWGLGVTITACIIAFAVFRFLESVVPAWRNRPFTTLENYTMSSAASAAGYMSSAGLVSALPALLMTTGRLLEWWEILLWLGSISALGVFMAIPLKRQLINVDQLPFPSGIATAETLRSMHGTGGEAAVKARSLFVSGLVGAAVAVWRDLFAMVRPLARFAFPAELPFLPTQAGRDLLANYTIGIEGSLIMLAAGAIMGLRVAASMLVGSLLCFGVIGPLLVARGIVEPGYRGIVSWVLWPSTAMMVASGLLSFGLRWRTVLRAFGGLSAIVGRGPGRAADGDDPLARIEVPGSWFVIGTGLSGLACVLLGHLIFGIGWWMGIVAVAVTFLLSIVAARATGETDITPIGAMGKITQLVYGVLAPSNITTNLMTASITSGAASHAADLLTDLKSGYLLGGNPRKQTISQLFGVLAGAAASVPAYCFVVQRHPERLGSEALPAPAAKVWAGVAELLAGGIEALPAGAREAIVAGAVLGIVLTLLEEFAPARWRPWIPSTTGLGIAGVIPAFNSIAMFAGAAAAWLVARTSPRVAETHVVPVSSGLIAGESLMGVGIILSVELLRLAGLWAW
ncbi:MAG: OPT family oligopeptide transporter [Planctomycetia bacterium]|nr:OPT family oligopeptide transporter [Planctomycetia bacterium]